jgi:hypothetical protein
MSEAGATLRIDARFCGPPDRANGGYVAGLVAAGHAGPLTATFRRPVRLDTDLRVLREGDDLRIMDGADAVVEVSPGELALEVPFRPSFAEAEVAASRYLGLREHPFPTCFVCGTRRSAGDGLRIFAGPVEGLHCVASPWVPDATLAGDDGRIRNEILWAALDCPGGFATFLDVEPRPGVLGRITGQILDVVHADEPCVAVGWPIAHDGRKHRVATAILNSKGIVCGAAVATWIDVLLPASRT